SVHCASTATIRPRAIARASRASSPRSPGTSTVARATPLVPKIKSHPTNTIRHENTKTRSGSLGFLFRGFVLSWLRLICEMRSTISGLAACLPHHSQNRFCCPAAGTRSSKLTTHAGETFANSRHSSGVRQHGYRLLRDGVRCESILDEFRHEARASDEVDHGHGIH